MVALFKEVDERKTISNVRNFFEHDFVRIQQQAHVSFIDVKSPIISGMPRSEHYGNATDEKFVTHIKAIDYLNCVVDACKGLNEKQRLLIELRYFKGLDWTAIEQRAHVSKRRCHDLLNEALLGFAEAFTDTMKLQVFKTNNE